MKKIHGYGDLNKSRGSDRRVRKRAVRSASGYILYGIETKKELWQT